MVRLSKHTLPKGKAQHGQKLSRTNKHKKDNIKCNPTSQAMDIEHDTKHDSNSVVVGTSVAPNLKSKEDKKLIRSERQKRNVKKNLYKVRNGNCTGKNGPRAINRTSMK
jgi:hypothetical protein